MVLGVLVASWCARGLAFAPAAPASARGAPLAAQVRKVGIVGGGTVGGGIVEILERRREQLVEVARVQVRAVEAPPPIQLARRRVQEAVEAVDPRQLRTLIHQPP